MYILIIYEIFITFRTRTLLVSIRKEQLCDYIISDDMFKYFAAAIW
jgi:hypothetical protein